MRTKKVLALTLLQWYITSVELPQGTEPRLSKGGSFFLVSKGLLNYLAGYYCNHNYGFYASGMLRYRGDTQQHPL